MPVFIFGAWNGVLRCLCVERCLSFLLVRSPFSKSVVYPGAAGLARLHSGGYSTLRVRLQLDCNNRT